MHAGTLARMDDRELGEYMTNHRRRIAAMNRLMEDLNRPPVSYATWLGEQLKTAHDEEDGEAIERADRLIDRPARPAIDPDDMVEHPERFDGLG